MNIIQIPKDKCANAKYIVAETRDTPDTYMAIKGFNAQKTAIMFANEYAEKYDIQCVVIKMP